MSEPTSHMPTSVSVETSVEIPRMSTSVSVETSVEILLAAISQKIDLG
eukprot:CAMPEP_0178606588 /NCGR_PEP_ID=MMETSP0697-20121206/37160_1 /TAXON_ID=265572 /ORGANISM="Extubocellulus spinifer, Strain CCMP396" /LENGTH=47 /DNA_ID= /DNA_START= /DNA_END= /DNA_ORIENTATION=